MRITQSMYYQTQNANTNSMAQQLFDVNEQISSGNKFQYAYQAPVAFAQTMNLDNEINTFNQVSSSANSGLKFSQQTDSTISSITLTLDQFKTKLIQANSAANSPEAMSALASEMKGLETQLKSLANTSINGQYIFSGSMVNQKPIDNNGNYLGNDQSMTSFLGSNVTQAYNITGQQLFLGQDSTTQRMITTNAQNLNQSRLHPEIMTDTALPVNTGTQQYIAPTDTVRDLMGASNTSVDNIDSQNHFYITGTKHDGSTLKATINMNDGDSVQSLLDKIGQAYGNTSTSKVVNVSLNSVGQIVIQDNLPGSSKLDFHMVGNIDASGPVNNLDNLNSNGTHVIDFTKSAISSYTNVVGQQQNQFTPDSFTLNMDMRTSSGDIAGATTLLKNIFSSNVGSIGLGGTDANGNTPSPSSFTVTPTSTVQDLLSAIKGSYSGTASDFAINMTNGQINFSTATGASNGINIQLSSLDAGGNPIAALSSNAGVTYDNAVFIQSGSKLTSNVSQIVHANNSYATDSTKLSDVSGVTPFTATGAPQQLKLSGIDTSGNPVSATIDMKSLADGGSSFTVGGVTYPIYDALGNPTDGNNMTYKQLTDSVNMIMSNTLPATNSSGSDYNTAIGQANIQSSTSLNNKGQLVFQDNTAATTKASLSLTDANSTTYPSTGSISGSSLQFNSNSALTISDPKTDFFSALDEMISSVSQGKFNADVATGDLRNAGIQNGIQMIDDLNSHISTLQSQSGVHSQSLQAASDRAQTLTISAQSMRSNVSDTDIAQATLQLNQLQLGYQAVYSTIAKVSQLSLVNYIK